MKLSNLLFLGIFDMLDGLLLSIVLILVSVIIFVIFLLTKINFLNKTLFFLGESLPHELIDFVINCFPIQHRQSIDIVVHEFIPE